MTSTPAAATGKLPVGEVVELRQREPQGLREDRDGDRDQREPGGPCGTIEGLAAAGPPVLVPTSASVLAN